MSAVIPGQLQTQSVMNNMYSPHQFIDYAMTNYIFTTMNKLADKEFSFSIIGTILIILSLSELKSILIDFLKNSSSYIKENYKTIIINLISYIKIYSINNIIRYCTYDLFFKILYCFKKNMDNHETENIINDNMIQNTNNYNNYYEFKYTVQFMQNLLNYMDKNKQTCNVNIDENKKLTIINLEEINITEKWKNLTINFRNFTIRFLNNISLKFQKKNNKLNLIQVDNIVDNTKNNNILTFSDLLPNSRIKYIIKKLITKENIDKIKLDNNKIEIKLYNQSLGWLYPEKFFAFNKEMGFEYNFVVLLKTFYTDLNLITSFYEFIIFTSIMIKLSNTYGGLSGYCSIYNNLYRYIKTSKKITVFDNYVNLDNGKINEFCGCTIMGSYSLMYNKIPIKNIKHDDDLKPYYEDKDIPLFENFIKKISQTNEDILETSDKNNNILINIESIKPIVEKDLYDFIDIINDYSFMEIKLQNKIKIYNITMNKEKIVEILDNPEYNDYIEKYNLVNTCAKESESESESESENDKEKQNKSSIMSYDKNLMLHLLPYEIPPKKIKNDKIVKQIKCDLVNEKSKTFDTLYLREKDTKKLKFALENFNERKELLEELGLPNKLGILLYGEPGTGKTSTIWAIGTYLKKNIYYINMNTIETNEDLQMVFDYVNKNCINGGIICFEDIDAMTSIVHKRKTKQNKNKNENLSTTLENKKGELTLEYILNILQGTLTYDGTTFIVTTNHLDLLDPAFYRDGRFDVRIEMKKCDKYQIQNIYKRFIKRELDDELLNQIPENKYTPANIIFHLKDYILEENCDREIVQSLIQTN